MTKREKILQTAMNLFIDKGIQSTSTALIAKEAGVATGTLFHHFKTKEELVHALYNLIFDSLINLFVFMGYALFNFIIFRTLTFNKGNQ